MSKLSKFPRDRRRQISDRVQLALLWLAFASGFVWGLVRVIRNAGEWQWRDSWAYLVMPAIAGLVALIVVTYVGGGLMYGWEFLTRVWKWLVDKEIERRKRRDEEAKL